MELSQVPRGQSRIQLPALITNGISQAAFGRREYNDCIQDLQAAHLQQLFTARFYASRKRCMTLGQILARISDYLERLKKDIQDRYSSTPTPLT
jgi:hypothetical protein